MSETKENVQIKYSSYTQAQKRATQKYRENNKQKVNEQRKKYYQNRKERDPEFLEYKRKKAKEYYLIKKLNKLETIPMDIDKPIIETIPMDIDKPIIETIPMDIDKQFIETLPPLKIPETIPEEPATLYQEPKTPKPNRNKMICKKKTDLYFSN